MTVAGLLKSGWQIAGYSDTSDGWSAFILFQPPDQSCRVQCRTGYDVMRERSARGRIATNYARPLDTSLLGALPRARARRRQARGDFGIDLAKKNLGAGFAPGLSIRVLRGSSVYLPPAGSDVPSIFFVASVPEAGMPVEEPDVPSLAPSAAGVPPSAP